VENQIARPMPKVMRAETDTSEAWMLRKTRFFLRKMPGRDRRKAANMINELIMLTARY